MPFVHEMRRLRAEHAELARLSRQLADLLEASAAPPSTEIEPIRAQLRDTLTRHLKCEDWALYPRLRAAGETDAARLARDFADAMGHVADDYDAYDRRWPPARVAAEWPAFRAESRAMLAALDERMERENRELYPLVDRLAEQGLQPSR
ncbi:hemerythrin domain-containing protein [Sphingopyxis sp. GW247-27LB]|uniref:hemerythrin domain-containing protein n=1 Tax=Sphingopyxis sp. GW247-27LB TaxID=2012632 RepID=UPI000BA71318|nr:hemerythrin domain-containing protein [Sphingopyxis sp. GW247-27LB]PAL20149.1 hypothetical protein CD928_17195 [Sphingopyxis sp. GW247-27LB]